MNIYEYIIDNHNSNVSDFARYMGVQPNQANRWIQRGCEVVDGVVWCPVSKHEKD